MVDGDDFSCFDAVGTLDEQNMEDKQTLDQLEWELTSNTGRLAGICEKTIVLEYLLHGAARPEKILSQTGCFLIYDSVVRKFNFKKKCQDHLVMLHCKTRELRNTHY